MTNQTHRTRLLQTLIVLIILLSLCFFAWSDSRGSGVRLTRTKLAIPGLKQDYDIFLIADTHISLCDTRDAALMEKANARRQAFFQESGKSATKTFQSLITKAEEERADLTVFAGDVIDSAMYASIDFVQGQLKRLSMPYLFVLGNHDFEYGSEYFSKKAYQEYFPRLSALTGTGRQYVVKEYEDLVIAGINDQNNQLPKEAVKALLPYLYGKKPVVLVLHVPLQPQYADSNLERQANDVWGLSKKGNCRVLIGEDACKPNKHTKKLLDAVFAKDSPVAAVFAGHIHFYNQSMLDEKDAEKGAQVVSGAGYYGDAVKIHLTAK